jgi:hypothetical protein
LIIYSAVPYLLAAAPPVIVLLSILLGGSTMTRPGGEPMDRAQFNAKADSQAGGKLVNELDQRAAREELRRTIKEAQR